MDKNKKLKVFLYTYYSVLTLLFFLLFLSTRGSELTVLNLFAFILGLVSFAISGYLFIKTKKD